MTLLYIVEYQQKGEDVRGSPLEAGREPNVGEQIVTFTSAQSSQPFSARTHLIRVMATGNCHLNFNGTATTGSAFYLPANMVEYIGVRPGNSLSVVDA